MRQETDRDYHTRRAREELDRAYRADGWPAMTAHFRLSSLHMQKVRERSGPAILARLATKQAVAPARWPKLDTTVAAALAAAPPDVHASA